MKTLIVKRSGFRKYSYASTVEMPRYIVCFTFLQCTNISSSVGARVL